ncbi:hypothetical protein AC249_AIPGENE28596 [Exaiptasia diaphana]|nr:hypothetical protein AC249_AIPGENE28596 [Exaiptasia diaphana]
MDSVPESCAKIQNSDVELADDKADKKKRMYGGPQGQDTNQFMSKDKRKFADDDDDDEDYFDLQESMFGLLIDEVATTTHSDDSAIEIASEFGASIPIVNSAEPPGTNEISSEFGSSIPSMTRAEPNATNEVQMIPTIRVINIHRANIRKDMLSIFSDPSILDERVMLDVHFINSSGEEEVGRGSGLERDLFSSFWKDIYELLMTGDTERMPGIRHDFQRPHWEAIGRILIKGFVSCRIIFLKVKIGSNSEGSENGQVDLSESDE